MAASTTETNCSLSNVTACWEEENSLNTEQILLIIVAGFFLLGYALLFIVYKVFDRDLDDINKLLKPFSAPGSWRNNCGENCLKVFILFICVVIPTGGYLVIIAGVLGGGSYLVFLFLRFCADHPKKALDLFLFVLLNTMQNGSDVVLDILTAEDLGNPTPVFYQGLTIWEDSPQKSAEIGSLSQSLLSPPSP